MRALQRADCSTEGDSKRPVNNELGSSTAACDECGEILHGLNNALASVLLNAQVMAWKLPSYSRSKRYLHEIERNAQRGGELVKRLLERSDAGCQMALCARRTGAEAPAVAGLQVAVSTRKRNIATEPAEQRLEP